MACRRPCSTAEYRGPRRAPPASKLMPRTPPRRSRRKSPRTVPGRVSVFHGRTVTAVRAEEIRSATASAGPVRPGRGSPAPRAAERKDQGTAGQDQGSHGKTEVILIPERRIMLEISKILLPVDFSERASRAARYVVPSAGRFRAEVVLLHAVPPHSNRQRGIGHCRPGGTDRGKTRAGPARYRYVP